MTAAGVSLEPVTRDTLGAVLRLRVAPGQEGFVADNAVSIAEAYANPTWTPLAIVADGRPVGFAMIGYAEEAGSWWIIRLMVDAAEQGNGHGSAALALLLDRLRAEDADEAFITWTPDNAAAARLYRRAGFVPTGETSAAGEVIARIDLSGPQGLT